MIHTTLDLCCIVWEILQVFCWKSHPTIFHITFVDVPLVCWYRHMQYNCLWLFFRFFTSPTGRHGWPIFTIYTSECAFLCKEVPFRVSMMNFHIYPFSALKIWKFALWPKVTSKGYNSGIFKQDVCIKDGVFRVGQFNGIIQTCLRRTLFTMATNW